MRTTFDLPDPLFREVKIRAVQQGVKLKDLVASYIEMGLRGQLAPTTSAPPSHRVRRNRLGTGDSFIRRNRGVVPSMETLRDSLTATQHEDLRR
ncbi:MAG: hypothetical protein WCO57_10625 [Verrucomicrobiota bacterium]